MLFRARNLQLVSKISLQGAAAMSGNTHGKAEHVVLTSNQFRDPTISNATITSIYDLSPTVKGYKLKLESQPMEFKAGQWVDFFIPGVDMIGGFSMCSSPSEMQRDNIMELAVKYSEWPPANWLHRRAQVGNRVSLRVGGDFHYPDKDTKAKGNHDLLLVAGGVGINPLASIIFHVGDLAVGGHEEASCQKVHLLYSAKTKDELLFSGKLNELASKLPQRFSMDFITTQQGDSRIDRDILKAAMASKFSNPANVFCYLCGPPQMIKDVSRELHSACAVPKQNIKFELWW